MLMRVVLNSVHLGRVSIQLESPEFQSSNPNIEIAGIDWTKFFHANSPTD